MKKAVAILLICLYGLSALGVAIKQFYCCGKLKTTSLALIRDAKENCTNGNKSEGCCKTKYQFFKVKDSHFASDGINHAAKQFAEAHLIPSFTDQVVLVHRQNNIGCFVHAPPLQQNAPLHILYCIYRI